MSDPQVSVILIGYNDAARIVRALEGLGDEGERKKRDEGVPEDISHGE